MHNAILDHDNPANVNDAKRQINDGDTALLVAALEQVLAAAAKGIPIDVPLPGGHTLFIEAGTDLLRLTWAFPPLSAPLQEAVMLAHLALANVAQGAATPIVAALSDDARRALLIAQPVLAGSVGSAPGNAGNTAVAAALRQAFNDLLMLMQAAPSEISHG